MRWSQSRGAYEAGCAGLVALDTAPEKGIGISVLAHHFTLKLGGYGLRFRFNVQANRHALRRISHVNYALVTELARV